MHETPTQEQQTTALETVPKKKLRGGAAVKAKMEAEHKMDLQALSGTGLDVTKPFIPYSVVRKGIGGRPTIYRKDFHPEAIYNAMTPPICMTKEAAAITIGIGYSTLYEWIDKYDEFAEALRAAEFIGESYHAGRLSSGTIKYAQGLIFYMKNRHAWKDKTEIEHSRKVDDLVKDTDTEANRVGWTDIVPTTANVHHDVIDADIVEDEGSSA